MVKIRRSTMKSMTGSNAKRAGSVFCEVLRWKDPHHTTLVKTTSHGNNNKQNSEPNSGASQKIGWVVSISYNGIPRPEHPQADFRVSKFYASAALPPPNPHIRETPVLCCQAFRFKMQPGRGREREAQTTELCGKRNATPAWPGSP